MDCCRNSMAMGRVVCPKPRRAVPANFNGAAVPLRLRMRSNDVEALDSKPGTELLDLILHKERRNVLHNLIDNSIQEDVEAERHKVVPSSPPFFFGSPPCRALNPLVQDAHFRVEKPTSMCSSPSDSASSPSGHPRVKYGKKQAAVRVEGFDCQSSHVISMA